MEGLLCVVVVLLQTIAVCSLDEEDLSRVDVHATYDEKTNRFQIHQGQYSESSLAWAQYINAVNHTGSVWIDLDSNLLTM